jgi:hypothetical protein
VAKAWVRMSKRCPSIAGCPDWRRLVRGPA